jgi:hypothetical protein
MKLPGSHAASILVDAKGAEHPSGMKLRFVYGYLDNHAGSKIYDRINAAPLPRRFE